MLNTHPNFIQLRGDQRFKHKQSDPRGQAPDPVPCIPSNHSLSGWGPGTWSQSPGPTGAFFAAAAA